MLGGISSIISPRPTAGGSTVATTLSQLVATGLLMTCAGVFYQFNQMNPQARRNALGILHGKGFAFRLVAITSSLVGLLWAQQRSRPEAHSNASASALRYLSNVAVVGCAVVPLCVSQYVESLHASHQCAGDSAARRLLARISSAVKPKAK